LSTLLKLARVLSTTPMLLLVEARFGQEDLEAGEQREGPGPDGEDACGQAGVVAEATSLLHAINAADPAAARFALHSLRGIAVALGAGVEDSAQD